MGNMNESSRKKLATVKAELQAIVNEAVPTLPFDVVVAEGIRSKEQAVINYRKGRTKAELMKVNIFDEPLPGPKITWTLNSKHIEGKAVDIYPLVSGRLDDARGGYGRFDAIYHAMMAAAAKLKTRIRYGGDWDVDGILREKGETDSPHYELA